MVEVEFRCPRDRRTMFGKLFTPQSVETLDGYTEFACAECRRVLGKRGLIVQRVLHRYDLTGKHLETDHQGQR